MSAHVARRRICLAPRRAAILGAVVALLASGGSVDASAARAEDPLAIRVWPNACVEPCTIRITVRTEPDPDLRGLAVELDSPDFFRSSFIQLEGENAPLSHLLRFPALPAGNYEVRAVLMRASDDHTVDRLRLEVLGDGVTLRQH